MHNIKQRAILTYNRKYSPRKNYQTLTQSLPTVHTENSHNTDEFQEQKDVLLILTSCDMLLSITR